MQKITLSLITLGLLSVHASSKEIAVQKRTLKSNMIEVFNLLPSESHTGILGMLSEGQFYGRLRSNSFAYDFATNSATALDHVISGLGGSLLYKTARSEGLSFTAGAYYSYGITNISQADVGYLKSGKDTLSRYKVKMYDDYNLFSFAQYYAQFDIQKTTIKVGEQLWESLLTRSNDSKMIPNSFMGLSIESKDLDKTTLRAFYFTSEKLRDHELYHDLITVGDGTTSAAASWNGNDDSGVNYSLTFAALTKANLATNNDMNGFDIVYEGVKDLKLSYTHNMVPNILLHEAFEVDYKMRIADMTISPAFRILGQKDLTGGVIAGAASLLKASDSLDTVGYTNANSMSSLLGAARLVVALSPDVKLQYGLSYVVDMADIVAPWRGFPTGGYTRAMAQLNWYANTWTNMFEAHIDLDSMNIVSGMNILGRFAMQDTDDAKTGIIGDSDVLHVDVIQDLDALIEGLTVEFRLGMVFDARSDSSKVTKTRDPAYNEYRFEMNYLF